MGCFEILVVFLQHGNKSSSDSSAIFISEFVSSALLPLSTLKSLPPSAFKLTELLAVLDSVTLFKLEVWLVQIQRLEQVALEVAMPCLLGLFLSDV